LFPGLFDRLDDFDGDLYRNIKTIRPSQDLLDDLSDDPDERAYGEAAAAADDGDPELSLIIARPFEYGVAVSDSSLGLPATRFSDGTRYGVWYGSLAFETTLYETVYHWHRFIGQMKFEYDREIVADRRVFRVHCSALLVDLRHKYRRFRGLVHPTEYGFCHQVGTYLHRQDQNGLLTKSARCDGINAALLNGKRLSNPHHLRYATYRWTPGAATVAVEWEEGRKPYGIPV
jgi:hypothetical protein